MQVQDTETRMPVKGVVHVDPVNTDPATKNGYAVGERLTNGEACAALVASGVGVFALGLFTTLAEMWAGLKTFLTFNNGVGPLSGKTIVPVIIWLVVWAGLHFTWKGKDLDFGKSAMATVALIALGFLGTFPIFFQLFAK
jgi:hypothetical protein